MQWKLWFRLGLLLAFSGLWSVAQAADLQGIRMHEAPDSTRVVFDTSDDVKFKVFTLTKPHRVVVDLLNVKELSGFDSSVAVGRDRVVNLRAAKRGRGHRVVVELSEPLKPQAFKLLPIKPYGHRLVVDLYETSESRTVRQPVEEEVKKDRNVIIAIDAGHGGDDPGAIGPGKILEKTVVMQIARKLKARIDRNKGFEARLVRTGDYYLAHRKRTQKAREIRADLFISIHADAFKMAKVSGASVYTLSDRGASSETAAWLAERENRSDLLGGVGDVSLTDRDPVLASVLLDLSMDANRSQSIDAGKAVLGNLGKVTKLHKKSVEQAAFVVLKSPDMPSILVETGFISNPGEARRLSQAEHQHRVAKAIAEGVVQFMQANPPPETLLASLDTPIRYTIVRGDTLSKIAQRYGVTSKTLRSMNGLRSDKIKIGQTLMIPQRG